MKLRRSPLSRIPGAAVMALVLFLASCREGGEPTAPSVQARGGNGLTVSSVVPDNSKRGVTLDVTVNGSGFDQGSSVRLERQGVPAGGITTNATTFVSPKKLTANITIAATADTGRYDVAVTTSGGRKGVGIELFLVEYELAELGIIGGTWSRAHAISDFGEVVGASCTSECLATAFYWTEAAGQVALPGLPGYSRGGAYAITNGRQVFGDVTCRAEDPGCGGVFKRQLVRWDRSGSSWAVTPVQGCSVTTIVNDYDFRFLINNNQECVTRPSNRLALQTLSGGTVVSQVPLPPAGTNSDQAYGINDAAMVAGVGRGTGVEPIVWYRRSTGWAVIRLPLAASYEWGWATDPSQPDAAGRVWVSGFIEDINSTATPRQPVRWLLVPDGFGGFTASPPELLETPSKQREFRGGAAVAINPAGQAVGKFGRYANTGLPASWPIGGPAEQLPSLANSGEGRAADINPQGWIVGAVWDAANACERAAIWRQR